MAFLPFTNSPTLANYKESTQPTIIRSETEGIVKQAVRYSANYINYEVSYYLTDDQLLEWRDFFNNEISRGAASFDWINPKTGEPLDARLVGGGWSLSVQGYNLNLIQLTLEVFNSDSSLENT